MSEHHKKKKTKKTRETPPLRVNKLNYEFRLYRGRREKSEYTHTEKMRWKKLKHLINKRQEMNKNKPTNVLFLEWKINIPSCPFELFPFHQQRIKKQQENWRSVSKSQQASAESVVLTDLDESEDETAIKTL